MLRWIWYFFSVLFGGLKEDPSCGCLCVFAIVFCIGLLVPSRKSSRNSSHSHSIHSTKYSSYAYKTYEALPDTVDSVYICMSSSSYAFHARYGCGALSNCQSVVRKIPVKRARRMGRSACRRCSRHIIFKEEEE